MDKIPEACDRTSGAMFRCGLLRNSSSSKGPIKSANCRGEDTSRDNPKSEVIVTMVDGTGCRAITQPSLTVSPIIASKVSIDGFRFFLMLTAASRFHW